MPFHGILSALSLKKGKSGRKQELPGTPSLAAPSIAPASSPTLLDGHKKPAVAAQEIKAHKGFVHSIVTAEVTAAERNDEPPEVLPKRAAGTATSKIWPASAKQDKRTKRRTKDDVGFFEANGYAPAQPSVASRGNDTKLEQMFDGLRDPEEDTNKDEIGTQSVMNYLTSLDVDLESCEQFIVLEVVQAPALGVVRKKGFVEGWKATGPSITAQKAYIKERKAALRQDVSYFRKVYRAAFVAGKEENQKALALEVALIFWDMLFSPPGMVWKSNNVDWLAEWKNFLAEKWTRSVNRDMWNQTLEFALKTLHDETLAFWSEDGAWPGVIDDFVAWWKAKQEKGGGDMETD